MTRRAIAATLLAVSVLFAAACSEPAPEPTATPEPTPTPEPTATPAPTATPEPTPFPESEGVEPVTALFDYTYGVRLLEAGLYEEAIPQFNLVVRKIPDFGKAYYFRGVAYFNEELLTPALEDLDKAIELKPELADAYKARADVYEAQEEYDLAVRDLEEAIDRWDQRFNAAKIAEARERLDDLRSK